VLPDIQLMYGTTQAAYPWMVTAVVCTQCTRTELFTSNVDKITRHVAGARMISAGQQ
jgi:hypothetical protein